MRDPVQPFCTQCGALRIGAHSCPPEWLVWNARAEGEPEPDIVRAVDAQEAAERWPEENLDAQAELAGGGTIDLCVRKVGTETVSRYTVAGVTQPAFMAQPTRASQSEAPRV